MTRLYFFGLVRGMVTVYRTENIRSYYDNADKDEEGRVVKLESMSKQPSTEETTIDINDLDFEAIGVYPRVFLVGTRKGGKKTTFGGVLYNELSDMWRALPPPIDHRVSRSLISVVRDSSTCPLGTFCILSSSRDNHDFLGELYYSLRQSQYFYQGFPRPDLKTVPADLSLAVAAGDNRWCAFDSDPTSLFLYSFNSKSWSVSDVVGPSLGWGKGQASQYFDGSIWSFSDGALYKLCIDGWTGMAEQVRGLSFFIGDVYYGEEAYLYIDETFFYIVWVLQSTSSRKPIINVCKFILKRTTIGGLLVTRLDPTCKQHFFRFRLKGATLPFHVACTKFEHQFDPLTTQKDLNFPDIKDSSQLKVLKLPDPLPSGKLGPSSGDSSAQEQGHVPYTGTD